MASNQYANKVEVGGSTVIDLTADTVDAAHLLRGRTAHGADGAPVTGTYHPLETPIAYDYEPGYVTSGRWTYENSTNNHSDIYTVQAGHEYLLVHGGGGTRFRSTVVTTNPVGSTRNITGTTVTNAQNPAAYACTKFTSAVDGWLAVTKDNVSVTGLVTYLIDIT